MTEKTRKIKEKLTSQKKITERKIKTDSESNNLFYFYGKLCNINYGLLVNKSQTYKKNVYKVNFVVEEKCFISQTQDYANV